MSATQDTSFPKLVSLACHDFRTPLATIHGFARTLVRMQDLGEPATRYLGMVATAADQLGELISELSLAARIEGERYEPIIEETDTATVARGAAARLGEERVVVTGWGGRIRVDIAATERAVAALAQCALRHGGLDRISMVSDGVELRIDPIAPSAAPVVLGRDLRDLGAAVAVRLVDALGGAVTLESETLVVRLPQ